MLAKELCFSNNYNTVEPPFATTSCKMTTFWPGVFIDFHCFLKTLESDHLRHDVVSLCTVCVTPITVYEELLVTAWNYPYTQLRNSSNKFFAKIQFGWSLTSGLTVQSSPLLTLKIHPGYRCMFSKYQGWNVYDQLHFHTLLI